MSNVRTGDLRRRMNLDSALELGRRVPWAERAVVSPALAGMATLALLVAVISLVTPGDSGAGPAVVQAQAPAPAAATPAAAPPVEGADAYTSMAPSDGRNGSPFALVQGRPLFPLASSGLAGLQGAPVEMQGVQVQSVVGPNAMWIGETDTQRVLVSVGAPVIQRGALSPQILRAGDRINLSGRVGPLPDNPASIGLLPETGLPQAIAQTQLVEANSVRPMS